MSDSNKSRNENGNDNKTKNDNGNGNNKNKDGNKNVNKSTNINENKNNNKNVSKSTNINENKNNNKNVNKGTNMNENKNNNGNVNNKNMNENKNVNKKNYSADELLQYAYKHNQVPVVLFAKDKECRYIYTSEIEPLIKGGEEHSILGKTDMDIQYDPELGKTYYEQDKEIMRTGKSCHCYSEFIQDGRIIYKEIAKNPVYSNGEIIGVCGVVSDVTELMNMKQKFENLTLFDALTGLYNRNYFLKHDFDKVTCLPCTYIMCDCNNLKEVNDQIGHEAGDRYIREAAELLESVVPDNGICARWGGDEFLLIIPECDYGKSKVFVAEIEKKQRIQSESMPYMEIAVGVCVRYDINQPETEAIQQADQNMYVDKKRKKAEKWK